ncbi:YciI family protein [Agilicoccus flavus]|uniref:YciI family protein n=1 Tax=Agilicoccus flavus TaxID=2775968 RepID=UPI001CF70414|nr:YciI family protein [Agilicoccus flavus]
MPFFAVTYHYVDDAARLDATRPIHREFLASLAGAGALRASGPYIGVTPAAALLILTAESEQQVRDLLADDPFQQEQLVAETRVVEWNPVIGDYADQAGY